MRIQATDIKKQTLPSVPGGGNFINKIVPVKVANAKRQFPS